MTDRAIQRRRHKPDVYSDVWLQALEGIADRVGDIVFARVAGSDLVAAQPTETPKKRGGH